jgi:hypothetical protein
VHGLDEVRQALGAHVVEGKLPQVGAPKADTYEGDGYLIVRHPDSEFVRRAVHDIVSNVRVELG